MHPAQPLTEPPSFSLLALRGHVTPSGLCFKGSAAPYYANKI